MGRYRMRTYRGEKIEVTFFHSFFNESFDDRVLIFLRQSMEWKLYKNKWEKHRLYRGGMESGRRLLFYPTFIKRQLTLCFDTCLTSAVVPCSDFCTIDLKLQRIHISRLDSVHVNKKLDPGS